MTIEIKLGIYRIRMFALGDGKVRIALVDQINHVLAYTDEPCGGLTLAIKLVTGDK